VLFRALVWVAMDLVVLPLTRSRPMPVASGMFLTMLIGHMLVVGLPIAVVLRPRMESGRVLTRPAAGDPVARTTFFSRSFFVKSITFGPGF
jgi:hypothetical protein